MRKKKEKKQRQRWIFRFHRTSIEIVTIAFVLKLKIKVKLKKQLLCHRTKRRFPLLSKPDDISSIQAEFMDTITEDYNNSSQQLDSLPSMIYRTLKQIPFVSDTSPVNTTTSWFSNVTPGQPFHRTPTYSRQRPKKFKLISSPQEICDAYKEDFNVCLAEINPEPLPGKVLLEPVTTLSSKSASAWKDKDVLPLAELLAGRIAIDGSGENRQGANLFVKIGPDLSEYILSHPKIRSIIDPVYVVIDLSTNVQGNVALYPPVGSPHIAAVPYPGSNHVFVFNGPGATDDAQHLIGWRIPDFEHLCFKRHTRLFIID
ncbi:hypothetical protein GLOIN_2v1482876 [Rhizophagus clarus]|uniref:Uncharacterized protein n=1 Tax=Rhizophagus clarus TaxID=94130 RepID=A0A8H3MCM9_9GLOM|nr:hypothetical protein GLOIN_2v1482876 [Rhizophagus clarus]